MQTRAIALSKSNILSLSLPLMSFLIPFVFSGPQLITGSIVNSILLVSYLKLERKISWPVIFLPSIAALLHGVVFGQFTAFLIFFLPWIWLGNFIFVFSFLLFKKTSNFFLVLFFSSCLKTAILFSFAFVYFHLNLIPKLFLTSMGLFQLITAISGGLLSYPLIKSINKHG
jgi:hypothetical protein